MVEIGAYSGWTLRLTIYDVGDILPLQATVRLLVLGGPLKRNTTLDERWQNLSSVAVQYRTAVPVVYL